MEKVKEIISQIIEEKGLELVELKINHGRGRSSIKILVDTPTGNITLDQVSEITSTINDSEDFYAEVPEDFRLEVSSPGLDHPLKNFKDFRRQLGRNIAVKYQDDDTMKTISGRLEKVEEEKITLVGKFGEKTIPLTIIDQGKIEIKFK